MPIGRLLLTSQGFHAHPKSDSVGINSSEANPFIQLHAHPQAVSEANLAQINLWLAEYPYCQSLRFLAAKASANRANAEELLAKAAVFAPRREVLFQFINSTESFATDAVVLDENLEQTAQLEEIIEPKNDMGQAFGADLNYYKVDETESVEDLNAPNEIADAHTEETVLAVADDEAYTEEPTFEEAEQHLVAEAPDVNENTSENEAEASLADDENVVMANDGEAEFSTTTAEIKENDTVAEQALNSTAAPQVETIDENIGEVEQHLSDEGEETPVAVEGVSGDDDLPETQNSDHQTDAAEEDLLMKPATEISAELPEEAATAEASSTPGTVSADEANEEQAPGIETEQQQSADEYAENAPEIEQEDTHTVENGEITALDKVENLEPQGTEDSDELEITAITQNAAYGAESNISRDVEAASPDVESIETADEEQETTATEPETENGTASAETVEKGTAKDELIFESPAASDFFAFAQAESASAVEEQEKPAEEDAIPASAEAEKPKEDLSQYNDERMPYTFLWWLNKTRQEHASNTQPYAKVKPVVHTAKPQAAEEASLNHQIAENIFQLRGAEELGADTHHTTNVPFDFRKKEFQIIEKFIKEEPQIKPPAANKIDTENKAKKSSEDANEVVSETLAKIYVEQMLYHKALDVYKKLSLKYPEKSAYFASQIKYLELKVN